MGRRTRNILFGIILFAAVFSCVLLIIHFYRSNKAEPALTLTGYHAEEELDVALEKLNRSQEKASVIRKIDTQERMMALTLDGMLSSDQMRKIMDILEQNNIQATFFMEGVFAAEDDAVITEIVDRNFGLGNYTLYAEKHMEELTQEEMVIDFVKSKNVLDSITNDNNNVLKCNITSYTDELLHAAKCSNIDYVAESTVYLSSSSFSSYEAAYGYVQKLKSGSIISVKLSEELSSEEFELDGAPAEDLQVSQEVYFTSEVKYSQEVAAEATDIITMLEYLITALSDSGIQTVLVKDFPAYHEPDYANKFASLELSIGNELADVYTSIPVDNNWIGCSFKGIKNEKMLDEVLTVLAKNKSHAAFFVTGTDILKYPDRIEKIRKAGHTIENGGNAGASMIDQSFTDIYLEINTCSTLLKETFGITSELYMPAYGKYDITMRKAAKALGYSIVTYNKNPIIDKEKDVDEILSYFEKGLKKGDLIYFDLDYYEKLPEVLESVIELGKNSKLAMVSTTVMFQNKVIISQTAPPARTTSASNQTNDSKTALQARQDAAKENAIREYLDQLRTKNSGTLAEQIKNLHIVQDSVAFLFYDISNKATFNDVLSCLVAENATATFFVSEEEIRQYPERIEQLKNAGHEVGIVSIPKADETYESVSLKLYNTYMLLKNDFQINSVYVFQPWSTPGDAVKEAVSAMGFKLVGYDISMVKEVHLNATSAKKVVKDLIPSSIHSLQQGQMVYFKMNYYQKDNLLSKVMTELIHQKIDPVAYTPLSANLSAGKNYTGFKITSVGELLGHKDNIYSYPLAQSSRLPEVTGQIYPGQLADGELMSAVYKGYIGSIFATTSQELVDFSEEEIVNIDSTGQLHTDDNVIFLTFDDWGSDAVVNRLLYVLDKHNVNAVFFVRTNYIDVNPNLLRKIALAGHQIASHTDTHMTLANTDSETGTFTPLTKKQLKQLSNECISSYEKMEAIVGDIRIDGKPALKKWFRPPTLAVSKGSMEVVFDSGYDYIISGNFSTKDYEASDVKTLYNNLKNGILDQDGTLLKGSILVMHFSDTAKYTPEALDLLLTENTKKSNSDPSKFRVGHLDDYLTSDYVQVTSPVTPLTMEDTILNESDDFDSNKISEEFSDLEDATPSRKDNEDIQDNNISLNDVEGIM